MFNAEIAFFFKPSINVDLGTYILDDLLLFFLIYPIELYLKFCPIMFLIIYYECACYLFLNRVLLYCSVNMFFINKNFIFTIYLYLIIFKKIFIKVNILPICKMLAKNCQFSKPMKMPVLELPLWQLVGKFLPINCHMAISWKIFAN